MRVPMRGTGAERPVVAVKSGKPDGAKGVASFSLFSSSTAKAGGAIGTSKAVLYFQVGGVGRVQTGKSETRSSWSGL